MKLVGKIPKKLLKKRHVDLVVDSKNNELQYANRYIRYRL